MKKVSNVIEFILFAPFLMFFGWSILSVIQVQALKSHFDLESKNAFYRAMLADHRFRSSALQISQEGDVTRSAWEEKIKSEVLASFQSPHAALLLAGMHNSDSLTGRVRLSFNPSERQLKMRSYLCFPKRSAGQGNLVDSFSALLKHHQKSPAWLTSRDRDCGGRYISPRSGKAIDSWSLRSEATYTLRSEGGSLTLLTLVLVTLCLSFLFASNTFVLGLQNRSLSFWKKGSCQLGWAESKVQNLNRLASLQNRLAELNSPIGKGESAAFGLKEALDEISETAEQAAADLRILAEPRQSGEGQGSVELALEHSSQLGLYFLTRKGPWSAPWSVQGPCGPAKIRLRHIHEGLVASATEPSWSVEVVL